MTDPTEPTDPTDLGGSTDPAGPLGPTEARLRDALAARADGIQPDPDALTRIEAAVAADAVARRRRSRAVVGTGIAAALLIGVAAVAVLRGDGDHDQVVSTATDPATTQVATTGSPTTEPSVPTTPTVTVPATTAPPTTAPPATTIAPTTTVPSLPGGDTEPKAGSGTIQGIETATVVAVRVAHGDGYDRVVLEFGGSVVPDWRVEYVDPPITQDGSGEEVAVAGTAFLHVRLERAAMHDLDGHPTYTGPDRVTGETTEVTEAVDTGDFEGVVSWVVGVRDRVPFRVSTLSGPNRLVIDVAAP